ncbi:MAG: GNAT family N-acetyltransferase [Phycisphaeraceae bacterium]|nr:GNAT family N-acetyltransferase [Phycisphaeraceae bacterium]
MPKATAQSLSPSSDLLDHAILDFARGFALIRSRAHPYLAERVGPLWRMHDAPRKRNDYRREEWIAHNIPPQEVDRIIRTHTRHRFAVCAVCPTGESDEPLRAGYKTMGYHLGTTEGMMVHDLRRIPHPRCPATIRRVTPALAEPYARAIKTRPLTPEQLRPDAPMRRYVAMIGHAIVGSVSSVDLSGTAWCSSLVVKHAHRRRGIGRALVCRMLRDDRAAGAKLATLVASHTGALLYTAVGYHRAGTLLFFTPKRSKP